LTMRGKETADEKISRLLQFQEQLTEWGKSRSKEARRYLNQNARAVKRDLIETGCFRTYTIAPPPAVGGLVMRNVDPIDMMFDPPYLMSFNTKISDMIDQAVAALREGPDEDAADATPAADADPIQHGYVFIAMPMDPTRKELDDVHDAIKQVAADCGLHAERTDDVQQNERITDRILESIRKAQFIVADLTDARPNVFFEAGYAHGRGKTPIYIAKAGTKLEFDLKDYPVIFFSSMRDLREGLDKRFRALATKAA